jgi:malate dehydrogenase (oxaloacetate-decarboxylating)
LGFPGIFRGTLDVRASTITDEMCFAAAEALADQIGDRLDEENLLPTMDDWEVFPKEAAAVGMKAQEQGVAGLERSYDDLLESATEVIKRSRDLTTMMEKKGFIPAPPEE